MAKGISSRIKSSIFNISILSFLIYGFSIAVSADVAWNSNYREAIQEAKKGNTMILIQLFSPTCPYCRKMDDEVLYKPEMEKVCEELKCIKVNPNYDSDVRSLARKYRIEGYPATLIMTSTGDLVRMIAGYIPLSEFIDEINKSVRSEKEFREALTGLKDSKNDPELLYKVAKIYYTRFNYSKSAEYAKILIEADPDNKSGKTPEAYIILASVQFSEDRDGAGAIKILDIILTRWSDVETAKTALLLKGFVLIELTRHSEGREVLLQFKQKYPDEYEMNRRIDRILSRL